MQVSNLLKPFNIGSEDNGADESQIKALEILISSDDILSLHGEEAVKLIEELDKVRSSVSVCFCHAFNMPLGPWCIQPQRKPSEEIHYCTPRFMRKM
jgi:hypothetical protein